MADILRRAAVIDTELGAQASEATLREIAAEVGISASAISKAIAEHDSSSAGGHPSVPVNATRFPRLKAWSVGLASALLGFVTGALARASAAGPVIGDVGTQTNDVAFFSAQQVLQWRSP